MTYSRCFTFFYQVDVTEKVDIHPKARIPVSAFSYAGHHRLHFHRGDKTFRVVIKV